MASLGPSQITKVDYNAYIEALNNVWAEFEFTDKEEQDALAMTQVAQSGGFCSCFSSPEAKREEWRARWEKAKEKIKDIIAKNINPELQIKRISWTVRDGAAAMHV
jgi:hypothetical protein